MAMMMTGRVLLVCALCVLWCGAGGGYAWDFGSNDTLNEYYYGANGVFCKIFPKMYSCELKINASKAALQKNASQSGELSGQPNAGGSPGGQDQTLKENGSDQSQGDAGTQLQKPGEHRQKHQQNHQRSRKICRGQRQRMDQKPPARRQNYNHRRIHSCRREEQQQHQLAMVLLGGRTTVRRKMVWVNRKETQVHRRHNRRMGTKQKHQLQQQSPLLKQV
ncbi:mucin-associated surface protein (MASP), putative, partial [Trypanosoma cruzi]